MSLRDVNFLYCLNRILERISGMFTSCTVFTEYLLLVLLYRMFNSCTVFTGCLLFVMTLQECLLLVLSLQDGFFVFSCFPFSFFRIDHKVTHVLYLILQL